MTIRAQAPRPAPSTPAGQAAPVESSAVPDARPDRRPMRVVVDLNRCLGYAQCVFLAPEVFELIGDEMLRYEPNPDPAQRRRVLRAAAACPVRAIAVDRLDDAEEGAAP